MSQEPGDDPQRADAADLEETLPLPPKTGAASASVSARDETRALPPPRVPSPHDPTELLPPPSPPPRRAVGSDDVTAIAPPPAGSRDGRGSQAGTLSASARISRKQLKVPDDAERLGPYLILGEIARGGMGVVYKAYREDLDRVVALKVLIAGEHASLDSLARFRREVLAAASLTRHPNIVQVYDAGEAGEVSYFTMDFVEGQSLADAAEDPKTRPSPREAAVILGKIGRALEHAHEGGLVHRDVKPHNILLDTRGEPFLTDFGLAKNIELDVDLTEAGSVLGSPPYMPPEQARGDLNATDHRSDIYGLGATLYMALTGAPPFQAKTVFATLQKVIEGQPRPPRELCPALHRDLETICLKAMDKEPQRRYARASDFAADLEAFLDGRAISARPLSLVARARRTLERRPELLAALLALAAAVVLAGAYVYNLKAVLVVQTEPRGATLFVDGEARGETPVFGLEVPAGRHSVRAELEGYLPFEIGELILQRGETSRYDLPLVAASGTLVVLTEPLGAKVRVGREVSGRWVWHYDGRSPAFVELPSGPGYFVEATAPGYPTRREGPLTLGTGRERRDLTLDLTAQSGVLIVAGSPVHASVAISKLGERPSACEALGGAAGLGAGPRLRFEGSFPLSGPTRLPVGLYEVRADFPGHREQRRVIDLRKDAEARMRLDLSSRQLWVTELGPTWPEGPWLRDVTGDGRPELTVGRRGAPMAICAGDDGLPLPLSPALRTLSVDARVAGPLPEPGGWVLVRGGEVLAVGPRAPRWRREIGTPPLALRVCEREVLISDARGAAWSLDIATGEVRAAYGEVAARGAPAPLRWGEDLVIVGAGPSRVLRRLGDRPWTSDPLYRGGEVGILASPSRGALIAGSGGRIAAFDPDTGAVLGHFFTRGPALTAAFAQAPLLADIDGDGAAELVFAVDSGEVFAAEAQELARPAPLPARIIVSTQERPSAPLLAADLDGDGADEVVIASRDRKVYAWSERRRRFHFAFEPISRLASLTTDEKFEGSTADRATLRSLATADLDRDGVADLVTLSAGGQLGVISGGPGLLDWDRPLTGGLSLAEVRGSEVFVGTTKGHLQRLSLDDGRVLFERDIRVRSQPVQWSFGDLNGDGAPDAALAVRTGVVAVCGRTGAELWRRDDVPARFGTRPLILEAPRRVVVATDLSRLRTPLLAQGAEVTAAAPLLTLDPASGEITGLLDVPKVFATPLPLPQGGPADWLLVDGVRLLGIDASGAEAFSALLPGIAAGGLSPILCRDGARGLLVYGGEAGWLGLDLEGRLRWRAELGSAKTEPAPFVANGEPRVAVAAEGEVLALSLATGEPAWRQEQGEVRILTRIGDLDGDGCDELLCASADRRGKLIRSGRDGRVVWRLPAMILGEGALRGEPRVLEGADEVLVIFGLARSDGDRLVKLRLRKGATRDR